MRRRGTAGAIVCLGLLLLAGPTASADTANVTIGNAQVEFTPADAGGGTASIALTNLTDAEIRGITAVAKRPAPEKCTVDLDKGGLLPPQQTVTFKATAGTNCGTIEKELTIAVTADEKVLPDITAKVDGGTKPDWDALWLGFLAAFAAAAVLMFVTWRRAKEDVRQGLGQSEYDEWKSTLPYLKDTWSFKDSWASNVTAVAGLLAGVFGASDVLKGVLGDDTDEALALATIGGAVSAGLVGVAGVLAIACKGIKDGKFTVGGVLLGSAVALGAGGGQAVVVYLTAKDLELGLSREVLIGLLAATGVILVAYGHLSVRGVLIQGATPPPAPPEHDPVAEPISETVFAAAVIAAAADTSLQRADVDALLKALQREAEKTSAPAADLRMVKMPTLQEVAAARLMGDSGRSALP